MDDTLVYPVDSDESTIPESELETDSDGRHDQIQPQSIPLENSSEDNMKSASHILLTEHRKISEQTISDSSSDECDSQTIFQSQRAQRPKRKKRPRSSTVPSEVSKSNEMLIKAKSVWHQLNKEENRLKFKHLFNRARKFGGNKDLKSSQVQENSSDNNTNSFNQSRSPIFRSGPRSTPKLSLKQTKSSERDSPIVIDAEESPAKNKSPQDEYDTISSDSDCIILPSDENDEPFYPSFVIKEENPNHTPTFSEGSETLGSKKTLEIQRLHACLHVSSAPRPCSELKTPPVTSFSDDNRVPNLSLASDHSQDSSHNNPPTISAQHQISGSKSGTNETTPSIAGKKLLAGSDTCSKILCDSQMFTEGSNITLSDDIHISDCIDMLQTQEEEEINVGLTFKTPQLFYTSTPKPSSSTQKISDHAVTTHVGEPEMLSLDATIPPRVSNGDSVVGVIPLENPDNTAHISPNSSTKVFRNTETNENNIYNASEKLQKVVSATTTASLSTIQYRSSTCESTISRGDVVETQAPPTVSIHSSEKSDNSKSTDDASKKTVAESSSETDQQIPTITVSLPSCEGSHVDLAVVKDETTEDQEEAGEFHYSVVDSVVHIFDSDDEELFFTQSVFGSPHQGTKDSPHKNTTESLGKDPGGLSSLSTEDPDTENDEYMDNSDNPWEDERYGASTQIDNIHNDQDDRASDRDTRKLRSSSPITKVDSPNWDLFNEENLIDPTPSPQNISSHPDDIFEMDTQPPGGDFIFIDSDDDPYSAETQVDSVHVTNGENKELAFSKETQDILPGDSVKIPKKDVLSTKGVKVDPFNVATQQDPLPENNVDQYENVYSMTTQHDSPLQDNEDEYENVYSVATQHDSPLKDNVDEYENVYSVATQYDSPLNDNEDEYENVYSVATQYDSPLQDTDHEDDNVYSMATQVDGPETKQKSEVVVVSRVEAEIVFLEKRDVTDCYQTETQIDDVATLHKRDKSWQSERVVSSRNNENEGLSPVNGAAERLKHISSRAGQIRELNKHGDVEDFNSTTQVDTEGVRGHQSNTKEQDCNPHVIGVDESNIVEFMASTQVGPRPVVPKAKRYRLFPKRKPDASITEGLFDKFSPGLKKVDEQPSSDKTKSSEIKAVTSQLKPSQKKALINNLSAQIKLVSIQSGHRNTPDMSHQDRQTSDMSHKDRQSPEMSHKGRQSPDMSHQQRVSPEVFQEKISSDEESSSSLSDIPEDFFDDMGGEPSEEKLIRNDKKEHQNSQGLKNRSFQSILDAKVRSGEEKKRISDDSCSKSSLTVRTSDFMTGVIEKNNADVFPGDYRLRKSYKSYSKDRASKNVGHSLGKTETSAKKHHKEIFRSQSAHENLEKPSSKLTPSVPHHNSVASKNKPEAKDLSISLEPNNKNEIKKGSIGVKRSFSSAGEYVSSVEYDKSKKKSLPSVEKRIQPESPRKRLKVTQSVKNVVPKIGALTSKLPGLKRPYIDIDQNKSPVKRQKNIKFLGPWLSSGDKRVKQKDSKKNLPTTSASISLNIEKARQRMLERESKVSTALHKANVDHSKNVVHHAADKDVEMPCTQDIMAQGLPILTAHLPVNKAKLTLGLPSQGRLASEENQNNSNSDASGVYGDTEPGPGGHGNIEPGQSQVHMKPSFTVPSKSSASLTLAVQESSPPITKSSNGESHLRISVKSPNDSVRPESSAVNLNTPIPSVSYAHNAPASRSSLTSCQKSSVDVRLSVKSGEDRTLPRSILKQPDKMPERKSVNFRDSQNTFKFIEPVSRPFKEVLNNVPPLRDVPQLKGEPQSNPEFVTSVVLKILSWNPDWLLEYDKFSMSSSKVKKPPPLLGTDDSYSRLRMYFETFKEYLEITSNLLILETWESVYQDWKNNNRNAKTTKMVLAGKPYYAGGKDGKKDQVPLVIDIIGMTSKNNRKDQICQDDFLILKGFGQPKGSEAREPVWREQFAVVQNVTIHWNRDKRWLKEQFPHFENESDPNDGILIYQLTLKIVFKVNYFPVKLMEIRKISTLKTTLRQMEALTTLPENPLCGQLLCPSDLDVFFPDQVEPGTQLTAKLNSEQARAVASIKRGVLLSPKAKKVFFLQGPAGTGKTQTIMALIHQILLASNFKARICLATPSNAAVDEIAKRIIQFSNRPGLANNKNISLVRIGNRDSINPLVRPFYWETLVEEQCKKSLNGPGSSQAELDLYRRKVSDLRRELADPSVSRVQKASKDADLQQYISKIKSLESELHNIKLTPRQKYEARCRVMDDAHVICGTLSSFGLESVRSIVLRTKRPQDQPFTCLIIDEATQAIEVDCLIPLQYKMTKVVLVGDQKQLPATVLSQKANDLELGRSLFERLNLRFEEMQKSSSFRSPIMMLVRQYRMHPEVLALPNNLFYDGKLKTDESVLSRKSFLAPYLVFDVQGGQESSNERSLSNVPEAECTASLCSIVMEVLKEKPDTIHKRIGVVCPYADQKQTILSHLRKRNLERIEVNTVDGFQGQERDVIIMSCVRAQNNPTTIGFLADKRRMNVALTRAKFAMYVLGHFETLKTNGLWAELYEDACNRKLLVEIKDAGRFSSVACKRLDLRKNLAHLDR